MDDKSRVARATALLAANAYSLIQTMAFIDAHPQLPGPFVAVVLAPCLGMAGAYAMLEPPHANWEEWLAGLPLVAMLLAWIWWQYKF